MTVEELNSSLRKLVQHKSGKVFALLGFALDENKDRVVILSDITDGLVYTRKIDKFVGEEATFQLAKLQ